MPSDEIHVFPWTPMPPGYDFVRKGNVYVTGHCRRQTHDAGKTVYVVTTKAKKVLGLRCPATIVAAVRAAEQATRTARHGATAKRDAALATTFREALLEHYPNIPPDTVSEIVQHALKKHARRVARTSTLDEAARVKLAVRAHIRHRWTDYDAILRGEGNTKKNHSKKMLAKKKVRGKQHNGKAEQLRRAEARAATLGKVNTIERQWAGKSAMGKGANGLADDEESVDDESSGSEEEDDDFVGSEEDESDAGDESEIEEDEDDEEEEDNHMVHRGKKHAVGGHRSGQATGIASRRKGVAVATKTDKGAARGAPNAVCRVQKTAAPSTPLRKVMTRSSKTQATERIARHQQTERRAGDKRETAIVIDSDSDWEP